MMYIPVCKDNQSLVSPALIIIPDISGFTRYMNEADLIHSQVNIAQLLETILENNTMGLTVSEIEGDAILFYDLTNHLTLKQIIEQCELMFLKFHEKLLEIKQSDCQCGACQTLQSLFPILFCCLPYFLKGKVF